jgi:putative transposase
MDSDCCKAVTPNISIKNTKEAALYTGKKAKAKGMSDGDQNYAYIAFHYIHKNPLTGGLVSKLEDWKYSSYCDYAGLRNGTLCDKILAIDLIGFHVENFINESYSLIDKEISKKIFVKDDHV